MIETISALLCEGRENAVSLQQLVRLTGLSEREVRRQIQRERRAGILILSDNLSGYFLAANSDDLRRFSRSMSHRSREILGIAQLAADAADQIDGQEKLEAI